jgi:hypothetical protein
MHEFNVGDRVRLRLDTDNVNFGETSREIKNNRTIVTICSVIGRDIRIYKPGTETDAGVRWYPDWVELAKPKTVVILKKKVT